MMWLEWPASGATIRIGLGPFLNSRSSVFPSDHTTLFDVYQSGFASGFDFSFRYGEKGDQALAQVCQNAIELLNNRSKIDSCV
jgi:hypothetical protein